MLLDSFELSNFRCFEKYELDTKAKSLFLVGANGCGKSSLLLAMAKALGRDRGVTRDDFRDVGQPIELIATLSGFSVADQGIFPKELSFKGKPTLRIGVRATWNQQENSAETIVGFPDHGWRVASHDQREALPAVWLPASREPAKLLQLAGGRSLLARMLDGVDLGADLSTAIAGIEDALSKLSDAPGLDTLLMEARDQLAALVPSIDPNAVTLGSRTTYGRELLREFDLRLRQTDRDLPLGQLSSGFAQLLLFAFALNTMKQAAGAVLLVDEPEIALHPHAQRALVAAIRGLPNQSLIATHSASVLDRVDPRLVARMFSSATGIETVRASGLTDVEAHALIRYVNPLTSEAMFARKVVMVEGPSDRIVVHRLATRFGRDLDAEGISVLSLDGGSTFGSYFKLFGKNGLGSEVLGICDEDKENLWRTVLQSSGIPAADRPQMAAAGFFVCVKDMEQEFIRAIGLAGIQGLISAEGEAAAFAKFAQQPANTGLALDEQLRSFLHRDNIRWAVPLVDALDLKAVPGALNELFGRL